MAVQNFIKLSGRLSFPESRTTEQTKDGRIIYSFTLEFESFVLGERKTFKQWIKVKTFNERAKKYYNGQRLDIIGELRSEKLKNDNKQFCVLAKTIKERETREKLDRMFEKAKKEIEV